jgi:hypothetical protein
MSGLQKDFGVLAAPHQAWEPAAGTASMIIPLSGGYPIEDNPYLGIMGGVYGD